MHPLPPNICNTNASALLEKPFQSAFQTHLQCEFTARCFEDPARGALSRACILARKTSPISSMPQLLASLLLVQSPAQALGLTSLSWQTFPPGYSPTTPVPPAPATPPALAPPWCSSPLHSASKSCYFSFTWTYGCFPLSPAPPLLVWVPAPLPAARARTFWQVSVLARMPTVLESRPLSPTHTSLLRS